jgi:hypothetical protein
MSQFRIAPVTLAVLVGAIWACADAGPVAAPSITRDPRSVTAAIGDTVAFSVSAVGDRLRYQWKKNGVAITGATEETYVTPPVAAGDEGSSFTVTVSNKGGARTSFPAALHVGRVITLGDSVALAAADSVVFLSLGAHDTVALHVSSDQGAVALAPGDTGDMQLAMSGAIGSAGVLYARVIAPAARTYRLSVSCDSACHTSTHIALEVRPPSPLISMESWNAGDSFLGRTCYGGCPYGPWHVNLDDPNLYYWPWPGGSYLDNFFLKNIGGRPATITMSGLQSWMSVSKHDFVLQPGDTTTVTFGYTAPSSVAPGIHSASMRVSSDMDTTWSPSPAVVHLHVRIDDPAIGLRTGVPYFADMLVGPSGEFLVGDGDEIRAVDDIAAAHTLGWRTLPIGMSYQSFVVLGPDSSAYILAGPENDGTGSLHREGLDGSDTKMNVPAPSDVAFGPDSTMYLLYGGALTKLHSGGASLDTLVRMPDGIGAGPDLAFNPVDGRLYFAVGGGLNYDSGTLHRYDPATRSESVVPTKGIVLDVCSIDTRGHIYVAVSDGIGSMAVALGTDGTRLAEFWSPLGVGSYLSGKDGCVIAFGNYLVGSGGMPPVGLDPAPNYWYARLPTLLR